MKSASPCELLAYFVASASVVNRFGQTALRRSGVYRKFSSSRVVSRLSCAICARKAACRSGVLILKRVHVSMRQRPQPTGSLQLGITARTTSGVTPAPPFASQTSGKGTASRARRGVHLQPRRCTLLLPLRSTQDRSLLSLRQDFYG